MGNTVVSAIPVNEKIDMEELKQQRAQREKEQAVEEATRNQKHQEKLQKDIAAASERVKEIESRCVEKYRKRYVETGKFETGRLEDQCYRVLPSSELGCDYYAQGLLIDRGVTIKCEKWFDEEDDPISRIHSRTVQYKELRVYVDHTRFVNQ